MSPTTLRQDIRGFRARRRRSRQEQRLLKMERRLNEAEWPAWRRERLEREMRELIHQGWHTQDMIQRIVQLDDSLWRHLI